MLRVVLGGTYSVGVSAGIYSIGRKFAVVCFPLCAVMRGGGGGGFAMWDVMY